MPYYDSPQSIGHQQTVLSLFKPMLMKISAPHMHANAASALEEYARPGAKVLDVGCGSGYLTAVTPHFSCT
jgi:protein-L-isoaspartate(D-aspartate) O-methyltransferase